MLKIAMNITTATKPTITSKFDEPLRRAPTDDELPLLLSGIV
jgi:hypothetical protein